MMWSKKMKNREILLSIILLIAFHLNTSSVFAQTFPVKTLNPVIPFHPVGGVYSLMKIMQAPLQKVWVNL